MLNILNHQGNLRYHLTPIRMPKITNIDDSLCLRECRVKGIFFHSWWKCKVVQPLWKLAWPFLQKLVIDLPQDSDKSISGKVILTFLKLYDCFSRKHIAPCDKQQCKATVLRSQLWQVKNKHLTPKVTPKTNLIGRR